MLTKRICKPKRGEPSDLQLDAQTIELTLYFFASYEESKENEALHAPIQTQRQLKRIITPDKWKTRTAMAVAGIVSHFKVDHICKGYLHAR